LTSTVPIIKFTIKTGLLAIHDVIKSGLNKRRKTRAGASIIPVIVLASLTRLLAIIDVVIGH